MGSPRASSPILALMYNKAPSINLPNFVPFNLSTIYLMLNFVDFVESVTDRPTKNKCISE